MDKEEKKRTLKQNRALHLLFRLIADSLNEAGYDMRRALQESIDIPWNEKNVKEFLWRPVQEAQVGKESTTELTTKEIDEVFDTLNRYFGQRFSLHIPFPSIEDVINQQRINESTNGKNMGSS